MAILAALWYEESHDEKPTQAAVSMKDETIVVNGTFTECYSFEQLLS